MQNCRGYFCWPSNVPKYYFAPGGWGLQVSLVNRVISGLSYSLLVCTRMFLIELHIFIGSDIFNQVFTSGSIVNVHCMSFWAKYQICAEKCHNNALDASGISESLEKLLVFKFAIFWKGGRKVAVCEVSVKNYDIFFSGQEIWFCLNRKKIGNHLRVNLKCCKSFQSSSCFHN